MRRFEGLARRRLSRANEGRDSLEPVIRKY
jgi:hypothetical protein